MATLTKKFNFVSTEENWSATCASDVFWGWYHTRTGQRAPGTRTNPPLSTYGGSVRFFARGAIAATNNYMEWAGTWEDLGIPAGSTVTAVQGDYLYRWYLRGRRSSTIKCIAQFKQDDGWVGPFQFLDSGGSGLDTFSSEQFVIARGPDFGADFWIAYPQDPSYPHEQNVQSVTINTAGFGYVVNDVLTISDGNNDCTLNVDSVDGGGGITGLTILDRGTGYNPAGATFVLTAGGTGAGNIVDYTAGEYWRTEYPISETPASWGLVTGSNVGVPSGQQSSNSSIRFRINCHFPDESGYGDVNTSFLRVKVDHPTFTITYTPPANNSRFFRMF